MRQHCYRITLATMLFVSCTAANAILAAEGTSHSGKRLALRRDMTFGEIFQRFPKARMLLMRGLQDIDPVRDANLTVGEFARRFKFGWAFDACMCTLNNCLVLLENADRQIVGDPALVDYDLFHGLKDLPSPETTRPVAHVTMDKSRQGLDCDGGLPYLRWVLSDGLNAVQLQQNGPPIEMLTCFQRVAGMSCEKIFDEGFLDLVADGRRHRFDQVHLHSFGYENHSKANPDEKSSLLMWGDRMWVNLACPGKPVQWILDDSKMSMQSWAKRQTIRHGWDAAAKCLFFTTIDDRPNRVGVRPKAYDGFTDQQIVDFIGTEWPETVQGAKPMHTECWLAIGPDSATKYIGQTESMHLFPADEIASFKDGSKKVRQLGSLHRFSAQGSGCLMIGIGSTREGALAELNAAREGQDLPRKRQSERYDRVEQRLPRLEAPGHETLGEIAAMAPLFLESLKTGFALMRSRPHTGAICGGWDQMLVASPMVRAGDYEMTPRYLEHWLHQVALDGQIFHVSDVDLSPAMLYKRWDFDDFMYLIVAAQWIDHCNDPEMLRRLSAKCTHMLRVMLDQCDGKTGLIASRGIFPDWPTLECGRTGITYPAMENGVWYEALRWWEGLATRLGEKALSARIRNTAEKLRGCFAELYLDRETGMIWDAVRQKTYQPVRTFAVWSLTPFQGSFGHELFSDEQLGRIAGHVATAHLDLKFPYVKSMVGVEIPFSLEKIHWPLFDHMVAKSLRRGQSSRGLNDFCQIIERQYRWTRTSTETMNAYCDLSHDFLSQTVNWFGWGASAWYEAILSGFSGIWEEPDGLAYVCANQDQAIRLSNLPYRGGRWKIDISGSGRYVDRFEVDGHLIPGVAKVPEKYLTAGGHSLTIHRADQPASPLLLDSVGLRLIDASSANGALHVQLAGPGRAMIRFYSELKPEVFDRQQQMVVTWNPTTRIGRLETSRNDSTAELTIRSVDSGRQKGI